MSNLYALLLSLGLVVVVILSSELLVKLLHVPKEESRKFIHIGVSHWWLLAMFTMDSWRWAIIPPIIFIVLNLISWWTGMFSAMERKPRDPANLGTVYFPITLLILVILTWQDSPGPDRPRSLPGRPGRHGHGLWGRLCRLDWQQARPAQVEFSELHQERGREHSHVPGCPASPLPDLGYQYWHGPTPLHCGSGRPVVSPGHSGGGRHSLGTR